MTPKNIIPKALSYIFITIWSLFIIYSVIYKVYWLSFGLIGTLVLIFIFLKIKIKNKYLMGIFYLLIPVSLSIILRVFIFEICVVPTGSMEDTLLVGDRVIINKLPYGPRMPRSIVEVPWVHGLFFYWYGNRVYLERKKQSAGRDYQRWKGFREIDRNDIIIFDSPSQSDKLLIKRVVAIPGDTFEIKNGLVFINGKKIEPPVDSKQNYLLSPNNDQFSKKLLDSLNIKYFDDNKTDTLNRYFVKLSPKDLAVLEDKNCFDSIIPVKERRLSEKSVWSPSTLWTYTNFGPLIIPKKSMELNLSDPNLVEIYKHILNLELPEGSEDNLPTKIEIKNNYYFVLGDNRDGSIDSRIFGLVREDLIIGKGSIILFSSNKKSSFLSRSLKVLH